MTNEAFIRRMDTDSIAALLIESEEVREMGASYPMYFTRYPAPREAFSNYDKAMDYVVAWLKSEKQPRQ